MKHDQARALLDLIRHKRQQSGGIRAGLQFITAHKRKARNEKRQKKRAMQTAHVLKLTEGMACCSFFGGQSLAVQEGARLKEQNISLDSFLSNE